MSANDTTGTEFVFAGKTASEWREMAKGCRKESFDSFERCDTDGFLSQWANDTMARRYEHCAQVAEDGGNIWTSAIFDLEGNFVTADYREGQFGWYYLVPQKFVDAGIKRFTTTSSANKATTRAKNNAKKGITEGKVLVRAYLDKKTGLVDADWDALKAGEFADTNPTAYQEQDH